MENISSAIFFGKVREHLYREFPFVIYRKPDSERTIGLFQNNAVSNVVSDFSEKGYVFAPFNGNKAFVIPENDSAIFSSEISINASKNKVEFPINETSKSGHLTLVQKGIDAIQNQQFSKVVLSRKEIVEFDEFDLENTFKTLLELYPTAFSYCWFHPETGLWLGAFSEQLLKVRQNELHTMSVAGTQKWHDGDIIWQEKEKEEQQIVTDFIVENLSSFSDGMLISEPYTLKAGNIGHIKTDIKANLTSDTKLSNIISILHPTPAVCGMPKEKARQFITENENYDREFYSGFHGELNKDFLTGVKQTDLFVNLRCMKIENNQASLYIGGGITKDSIPENEWVETVNKAQTMKKVLAQNIKL